MCVHRKGATRALPPGHPDLPADLAAVGQPVLVPGSMGTASHVLVGVTGGGAFHSTCHGAGRTMSRTAARKRVSGAALQRELEAAGIAVRAGSRRGLAEEAPFSYKDVDAVVATVEQAGLARRVARLVGQSPPVAAPPPLGSQLGKDVCPLAPGRPVCFDLRAWNASPVSARPWATSGPSPSTSTAR